ncbi:hypothetical protein ACO22_06210 [Paracoccidioides brasiliensis]|nr:hypothetical protein ACO22_06210 [Paracoccidioides brasiliensis]
MHFAGYSGFNQYDRLFRSTPDTFPTPGVIPFDALLGDSLLRRYPCSPNRIVEVLAAGESNYEDGVINIQIGAGEFTGRSFTSRLLDYIVEHRRTWRSIQMADMVVALRALSSTSKPIHRITVERFCSGCSTSSATRYPAVLSVHTPEALSADEITGLVKLIRETGEGRGFAQPGQAEARTPLKLGTGNSSNILVLEGPREIYAQLRNIPSVNVFFENMSSKNLTSSPSTAELQVAAREEFQGGVTQRVGDKSPGKASK